MNRLTTFSLVVALLAVICFTARPIRNNILRILAPTSGTCYRCDVPWAFAEHHVTMIGEPKLVERDGVTTVTVWGGIFVLCEPCWGKLTPTERLPYYREWYDKYGEGHSMHRDWSVIESSVLSER